MNLTERLRSVLRPMSQGGAKGPPLHSEDGVDVDDDRRPGDHPFCDGRRGAPLGAPSDPAFTADLLGGDWREWQSHRYLVVDRRYPPGHRHGRVAVVDTAPDASGWWPPLGLLTPAMAGGRVLFVDLETTGLSGGAGTYAFLIGCAWFEGAAFRVRQYLLTSFAAERGMLDAMRDTADGVAAIATYNGKTFDLPVLDTRCVLHRMSTLFDGLPHLDLLHPARQLWKSEEARLAAVEASVLGHVRDGDVPGFEIPARYFAYVRSGDPRPLAAVLEHNRLDLLSLAMLTGRLAQLLEQGADAARTGREALGLGRLYQCAGQPVEARTCFARAIDMGRDGSVRAEALRAYAVLCRRAQQYDEAARMWRQLLDLPACPAAVSREAREALAVHCEHRLRDYNAARHLALESLHYATSTARAAAVHHRVARLDRKLSLPLF